MTQTELTALTDRELEIEWRKKQGWHVGYCEYDCLGYYVTDTDNQHVSDPPFFELESEAWANMPPVTDSEWLDEYNTKLTYGERRGICKTMSRLVNPDIRQFKRAVLIASLLQQEKD